MLLQTVQTTRRRKMLLQILNFGSSILGSLKSSLTNKAVFSQIFPNRIKTTTIEQQSLRQEFTSYFFETSFDMLNDTKLQDLKSIMTNEFVQGLPSDTEFGVW